MAKTLRRHTARIALSCIVSLAAQGLAQNQIHGEKPVPAEIYPQLYVLAETVVENQWNSAPNLINSPADLRQVEPGQCVRFAVLATGDNRNQLLATAKFGFNLTFAGRTQNFATEPPAIVKQGKPEGGDLVTEALAAAGIRNPFASTCSIAASQARWCIPADTKDEMATIQATVVLGDGKTFVLKSRAVEVKTLATARSVVPFTDMNTLGAWIQHYYAEPDPAQILPALRFIASDEKARFMPNIMTFFREVLKADPTAANDLIRALPAEERPVRIYTIPLLSEAGYPTESLLSGFKESERTVINSIHLPNPFDPTPDRNLPGRMDMLWAVFFATGRIEPVRAVASMLAWRADYDAFMLMQKSGKAPLEANETVVRGVTYGAAGWSLNALSRSHGLVADYIDALKESADTPATIRKELASVHTNPAFTKQ